MRLGFTLAFVPGIGLILLRNGPYLFLHRGVNGGVVSLSASWASARRGGFVPKAAQPGIRCRGRADRRFLPRPPQRRVPRSRPGDDGGVAPQRPNPLVSGQPRTWACGIIHVLGQLNFLPDKAISPT